MKFTGMKEGVAYVLDRPLTKSGGQSSADEPESYRLEVATATYGPVTFVVTFAGSDAWGADSWDVAAHVRGFIATKQRLKTIQAALDTIAKAPGVSTACA
jgi:hypothetical protein